MTDYSRYELTRAERKTYMIKACLILAFLGLLFYRSIIMAAICCIASKYLEKEYARLLNTKRRERLLEGFRDVLYSISGSVAAGRQMPTAIRDALKQVEVSFGKSSDIARELRLIVDFYDGAHGSVEELLSDFGTRSGLAEISQFASSYAICKRSGGDLENVCLKSANILLDRIAFHSEVAALIAQKKLDIAMLTAMPILVLMFLNLVSFSYLEVLYTTVLGRIIMTACWVTVGLSLFWSLRLTEIEL